MLRPFSLLRRSTGVVAVIALVMLIGATAAQADFTATAGKQFTGVVDATPSCTNPTSVMIDWGDTTPQSPGMFDATTGVSGSHLYAAKGTFFGVVHLFNADGDCGDDSFTA